MASRFMTDPHAMRDMAGRFEVHATQMNQAFRNIVNMLHGVRDGLVRDANNYEQQEQASQQILSS
ncbi:ESAT-6-like protein EsxK [Mycobacterium tuberculosis]|uniref:peptidase M22 n=1 Tax=Mycobacterium tuberculosis TaxID=1773 RepID=UPI00081A39CB|nr:peptidase M22 [Mycobacterium tuberculosis]ANZ81685.1 ESAT-6-like protein EsxK [Mycobacterium tuberculosis]